MQTGDFCSRLNKHAAELPNGADARWLLERAAHS